MRKIKAEELAAMVESTAAKLSGEKKVDLLLKIVIFLLVVLMDSFGSHDERTVTRFESEVISGLPKLLDP